MQKIVSSLTSGDAPDVMEHNTADATVIPQNAWKDSVTKQRGDYLAPYKTSTLPFHIWNSLVEKAGLKVADAPKTWDAFWDYFKPVQEKLRSHGMRGVYSLGLQPTTNGPADGNNLFTYFLAACGGYDIATSRYSPRSAAPVTARF
jgi:multiple sugar transport system substrate-binding protein